MNSKRCVANRHTASIFVSKSLVVVVVSLWWYQVGGRFDRRERDDWVHQPPRVLVAEAMVQELLVSLMEIQMNEKEEMILDEVDTVEIMRQLHAQLEQDEQMVDEWLHACLFVRRLCCCRFNRYLFCLLWDR